MKPLFTLLAFLCSSVVVSAQFKTIAEGEPFDEREEGTAKLVQMKNGKTIYLYFHEKSEVDVQVYDERHRLKTESSFKSEDLDSKIKMIISVFECAGDILVFATQSEHGTPTLYRLIIDGNTGNLKKDEKIAELRDGGNRKLRFMAYMSNNLASGFFVRKDPASEHYAVARVDNTEKDHNRRLEVIFFGPNHKVLSRAFYNSPEEKFNRLNFIDMVVIGDQKVSVIVYAYGFAKKRESEGELVIANLDAGSSNLSLDELDFTKKLVVGDGVARYNPIAQSITLLAACQTAESSYNEYASVIIFINPFERRVTNAFPIYPKKADEKSVELFGRRDHFNGMPQNLYIDKDGSFSVVFEEVIGFYDRSAPIYSDLGHLAVMQFDPLGKETGCYFIPKAQFYNKFVLQSFYLAAREGGGQLLYRGNQYKSFSYLHGKFKSYILFNDIEKNEESEQRGKITRIAGLAECDAFYFRLGGDETLVPRQYVFDKGDRRRDHRLALFTVSDYDPDRNVYALLKLEESGRSKKTKMVWLEPQ